MTMCLFVCECVYGNIHVQVPTRHIYVQLRVRIRSSICSVFGSEDQTKLFNQNHWWLLAWMTKAYLTAMLPVLKMTQ